MKQSINFNNQVLNYAGQPQNIDGKPDMLNKSIAQIIGQNPTGDAWKFGHWAMEVYQGKVLELDKSDADILKEWITAAQYPAILKMQALKAFG